jgi:hypothetical protein
MEDVLKSEAEAEEAHKAVVPSVPAIEITTDEEPKVEAAGSVDVSKKRKRRKKKKKTVVDTPQNVTVTDTDQGESSQLDNNSEAVEVNVVEHDDNAADQTTKPKKRKRRRSRNKLHKGPDSPPDAAVNEPVVAPAVDASVLAATQHEDAAATAETKPKQTRAPRKKKAETSVEKPAVTEPPVEVPVLIVPKPRRSAAKKSVVPKTTVTEFPESADPKKLKPAKRPSTPKLSKKIPE